MFALPVKSNRFVAPGIFELELERRGYVFTPGECAVLYNDGVDSRPYSVASGDGEDVLRFLIRLMEGGAVTPWLAARRPGDTVRIGTPFGYFRPGQHGPPDDPGVFVATGVGIAPFLSRLKSRGTEGARRPQLLYGVRLRRDAVDVELLRERSELTLAVSREDAEGCRRGRVTGLLETLRIGPRTHFYLCGLDAMVDEVAYWLNRRGVGHERVHTEVFFGGN